MLFIRELRILLIGLLAAFLLITLSAAYWAVAGPESLLPRDDNPRLFEAEAALLRGDLVDQHGIVLVTSVSDAQNGGRAERQYPEPSMNSILGYYSLRYGVGGAEAAYDAILRGDTTPPDLNSVIEQGLLHQPQRGDDVQLTLDLVIQQQVYAAMEGQKGAAVVLDISTGAVLALVSLPSFDPNTLDEGWETLTTAPDQPFFNRALQGRYQPGGILQTPLMTAAFIAGLPVNEPTEGASASVVQDTLTLNCVRRPPADRLALSEAYAFGCPAPFVALFNQLGEARVQEAFSLFGVRQPYFVPGFANVQPQPATFSTAVDPLTATVMPSIVSDGDLLADSLGQGSITLSPLDVAVMTAAIVNEGNAPQPYLLRATRADGSSDWQQVTTLYPTTPITTAETSRRVQELMRAATISGAATRAARSGMNIGGHTALAYSGDSTVVWFTGFVITGVRQGVAVALVLEDHDDTADAAEIGGQILEAAFNQSVATVAAPADE